MGIAASGGVREARLTATGTACRDIRGRLLLPQPDQYNFVLIEDGVIEVVDGRVVRAGPDVAAAGDGPDASVHNWSSDYLLCPGFIDPHIHFPQTQVIASYGTQLLDWLETYTFPAEGVYGDPAFARAKADFFCEELLRNGTTSAVVYGSVHAQSVDAVFEAGSARGMGLLAGKSMMDRNAPPGLLDTADTSYHQSKALIDRWHAHDRQRYVVTPRFAITSTEAQLDAAGALMRSHPDIYLQTHLAENRDELRTVADLFPADPDYTAVYERFGLLGPRSLFGHCIHLAERELQALSESGSVAVFCPTSNLFIGSGLFDWRRMENADRPVRTAIATDVGGGTSYSLLRTAAEAYKVLQLQGQNLPASKAIHALTLGNAAALSLDHEIGTLAPGAYADLIVLDARATPAMAHRMETVQTLEEELFVLMTMGDDRAVRATYIQGEKLWDRGEGFSASA